MLYLEDSDNSKAKDKQSVELFILNHLIKYKIIKIIEIIANIGRNSPLN